MDRPLIPLLRRFGASALLCFRPGRSRCHAALDATAQRRPLDQRATEWWTYGQPDTATTVRQVAEHGARNAGLEVAGDRYLRARAFTARLVHNSGAYAVPGWAWYYDQTPEQITALINATSARLIELERYDRAAADPTRR